MQYTQEEKNMLEKVNKIGLEMKKSSEDDFVFIRLLPYLDHLMLFLKQLDSNGMTVVFMKYEGVMKVMRMIENSAQKMEKEWGLVRD